MEQHLKTCNFKNKIHNATQHFKRVNNLLGKNVSYANFPKLKHLQKGYFSSEKSENKQIPNKTIGKSATKMIFFLFICFP